MYIVSILIEVHYMGGVAAALPQNTMTRARSAVPVVLVNWQSSHLHIPSVVILPPSFDATSVAEKPCSMIVVFCRAVIAPPEAPAVQQSGIINGSIKRV
jgi:phosphoribosylcarboxyaminoimidazole (NCAIR) mutase